MSQSIQYLVEDAVAGLIDSISGLNVYTANRTGKRLFPFASVQANINTQLLGNFTGVYDLNVAVNYSDTAVKVSQEDFDSEYCEIFEAFYSESPTLKAKIQAELDLIGGTCYMARIVSQSPTIRTDKRAWQRGLTLNIFATPLPAVAPAPSYIAALQFNDHRNSQYIGAI